MEVTLLTEDTRVHYTGDGVTKEFSYSFNPIDLSYVKVYKNLQQITTPDVTVASGVVTFNVAPAEGDSVVIMREKPLTYDSGIASKGIISSDSLDNMAVDLLGQIQQVNEKLDRAPVYPIDTTMTGEEILNQFNQDVQTVKDSRVEVEGKAEEINNTVSSGLTEISNATSESKSQITEEKNAAISAVEASTTPLIQKAEAAASEAEASRANAEEWAKSVDAENIVHKTGDETISGTKSFESHIFFSVNDFDKNNPYASGYRGIYFKDKNNQEIGNFLWSSTSDGSSYARVIAQSLKDDGSNNASQLAVWAMKDGTQYVTFPTPSSGDNSTKGATTNWVSDPNKSTNVVHRSGDETISGVKTFNGQIPLVVSNNFSGTPTVLVSAMDKTNKGKVEVHGYYTGNKIYSRLYARNNTANKDSYIDVKVNDNGTVETYAPTPPASDNSAQIATTNWVADPNKSTSVVHRSGNEEISGAKTFTGGTTNNSEIYLKNLYIDRDVNPSSIRYCSFLIRDKNLKQIANFYCYQNTDGSIITNMIATGRDGKDSRISVRRTTNGTTITESPTPPISDNSTQIATTNWFNQKIQVVSTLPASPNANVYYFVTNG